MKKITLLVLIATMLFACTETTKVKKASDNFTLHGTIKNAANKELYVGMSENKTDTISLDENGKFEYHGETTFPNFIHLFFSKEKFVAIILTKESNNIKLNADFDTYGQEYEIVGSEESKRLQELQQSLEAQYDKIRLFYDENKDNENYAVEIAKIQQEAISNHHKYLVNFIKQNPSSLTALAAFGHTFDGQNTVLDVAGKDFDILKLVVESFKKNYPESEHTKSVEQYYNQINERKQQVKIEVGSIAPEISLPSPKGDTINLSSLKGKYVLLDFWASWCRPCRGENPNLVKAYQKYHNKGFEIYQVSLDKGKEEWVNAIAKDNLTWKHVSDLKFWKCTPAKVYGVQGIPASFLLDKEGKIIAMNLRGEELQSKLAEIFK